MTASVTDITPVPDQPDRTLSEVRVYAGLVELGLELVLGLASVVTCVQCGF